MSSSPRIVAGRYEIGAVVGRGGMGLVYAARDLVLGRDVAIKMMPPSAVSEVEVARFQAEIRALSRMSHPHVVTLFDAGVERPDDAPDTEGRPFIVMELVSGPTLTDRIADGPMDPDEVARIGSALARGLEHAHAAGLVHRDVKPGNILFTLDGEPKLVDFGVARALGDTHRVTSTGHTVGTAAYLAPEQLSGAAIGGAADVYSLGLVLLEALTGKRAFAGGTPAEVALRRVHQGPSLPVSLGATWLRTLRAMTAIDPAERPSARDVAVLLSTGAAAAVPDLDTTSLHGLQPPVGAPTERRRRRSAVLVAAAVALLVGMAMAGVLLDGGSPPAGSAASAESSSATSSPAGKRSRTAAPVSTAAVVEEPVVDAPAAQPGPKKGHHKKKAKKGPKKHKAGAAKGPKKKGPGKGPGKKKPGKKKPGKGRGR